MDIGATFSTDRKYRYSLWRIWNQQPPCVFILLNPSRADETRDDPTIKRCQGRALRDGWGGIIVVNLFAWQSADPSRLLFVDDPIGQENDEYIRQAVRRAGMVICGWGTNGMIKDRDTAVLWLVHGEGKPLYALGFNRNGTPKHPLYVRYSVKPELLPGPARQETRQP